MTTKVLNDQSANVLANRLENVGQNASLTVGGNAAERIGRNRSVTVGGGAMQMLGMLAPLMQAGERLLSRAGARGGAAAGAEVGGCLAGGTEIAREMNLLAGNGGLAASGGHRGAQGAPQAGAAASLAGQVGGLIPGSGILTSFIEKVRSDTVGLARTEQIGIAKNTIVGNIQSTSVGRTKKPVVGEDHDYEAKRSIFGRTTTHTLHAKDKFVVAGPGGSITIDASGVTIRTKHLKVRSPQVDFLSGSPAQSTALQSDKPFVQECEGK